MHLCPLSRSRLREAGTFCSGCDAAVVWTEEGENGRQLSGLFVAALRCLTLAESGPGLRLPNPGVFGERRKRRQTQGHTRVCMCVCVRGHTCKRTHAHSCRACTRHVRTGSVSRPARPCLHPRGGCSARAQAPGEHGGAAVPEGSARCFPPMSLFPRLVCPPLCIALQSAALVSDVSLSGIPWSSC